MSTAKDFHDVFNLSPQGRDVLEHIEKRFSGGVKKNKEGNVDPDATLAAAGALEVVQYIRKMVNSK